MMNITNLFEDLMGFAREQDFEFEEGKSVALFDKDGRFICYLDT